MRINVVLVLVRGDWKQEVNRYFKENNKYTKSRFLNTFIWEMTDAAFSRNVCRNP